LRDPRRGNSGREKEEMEGKKGESDGRAGTERKSSERREEVGGIRERERERQREGRTIAFLAVIEGEGVAGR